MEIMIVLGYGLSMLLGVAALAIQIFVRKKGISAADDTIKGKWTTVFFGLVIYLNIIDILGFYIWGFYGEVSSNVLQGALMLGWFLLGCFLTEFERELMKQKRKKWMLPLFYVITAGVFLLELFELMQSVQIPRAVYYGLCIGGQGAAWIFTLVHGFRYMADGAGRPEYFNHNAIGLYNGVFLAYWIVGGAATLYYSAGGGYLLIGDVISIIVWSVLGFINLYIVWQSCLLSKEAAATEPDLAKVAERYKLSQRETVIAGLLLEGKSNLEIAGDLEISESSVKVHNHRLYKKLDAENRVQAVNRIRQG